MTLKLKHVATALASAAILAGCGKSETAESEGTDLTAQALAAAEASGFRPPDGGDGGRGGDIILRGNAQLWTLLHLRYTKHLYAEDGVSGGKNQLTGAAGNDVYIDVPLGTVAYTAEEHEQMAEITEDKQEIVLLKGGRGGKGNAFFKSATQQAPKFAQPGEPAQEQWITLELKLLADVGLVGFPNAGKSTLLSSMTT